MIETWQATGSVLASGVLVAGALIAVVRHMLRSEFVPRALHAELVKQVSNIERRLGDLPSEQDVGRLTARLTSVETGIAVVRATIEGVNGSLMRVEKSVDLLIQHQLRKDE